MVQYNFKEICIIPTASEFIDIVLSKTQRKTPTVVHRRYRISSIRQFYMRKVKFCAATIKERLGGLLSSFPRVDSIHPFYADLMHVLYDKDHYKLALGQLNATRNVVEKICKDYIKLLKFSDSLYRSKQLKRAAMGRMCTALKKLDISLKYLEEVRQHLSRLPSIDPAARTLILAGYPNVGKSSFVNKVSRADVEVQPYAFTTKSLFVGHFFHEYLRWQVIDTPGVLDHPPQELSGCNTIEMQAVTAIAHIQASVLFFVDLSPSCEYSVEQQLRLFEFLRPVFVAKPVVFVASKSDLRTFRDLPPREKGLIEQTLAAHKIPLVELSNLSEDGVIAARDKACALLLEARLARKLDSGRGAAVKARLAITRPSPRDHKARPPSIPVSVAAEKLQPRPKKPTVHEMQERNGGGGVFSVSLREHWDLRDPAWATHSVPEIFEGQNVSDWMDPDIEAKLDVLN
ncbi:hypothetical protein MHBO_000086 [Bonamia ostreae]|uniref:OBG-type G domain-containing protein n=1 Tax=Bonamia ostreae TaxID=126728 RepID=A0ABV2AEC0_9EUKA